MTCHSDTSVYLHMLYKLLGQLLDYFQEGSQYNNLYDVKPDQWTLPSKANIYTIWLN